MKKNFIGQTVITTAEKEAYESLEKTVKDQEKTIEDRENVIKKKNEELKEKNNLITGLEIKLSSIINVLEEKYESKLKLKDEQIESLKKDKSKYVGRCGGYQRSQNDYQKKIALLNENLKAANEKINNLKKRLKEDFVPISPMQYDNKITTVAQHKKNLAKGK